MHLAYIHYLAGDAPALSHVQQFAAAARELDHRVSVIASAENKRELPAPGPSATRRRLARYTRELRLLGANAGRTLRETEALRAIDPDLVLARHDLLTCSHALAARHLGLPLVLEVNAPVAESRLYFDEYWHLPAVAEWMEGWLLRHADGVLAVSSSLKDHLLASVSNPKRAPEVVPNGVDTSLFSPRGRHDPRVEALASSGVVVGFVGSFQHFHDSRLLRTMIEHVACSRPAARFLLVGDGPDAPVVRQGAAALGERALWLGSVPHEQVPALVRGMDVAVLAGTAFYCSPLKILEWMASGCAVVAPRTPAIQDLIEDQVEGILFPRGDAEALGAAVEALIDDPALRTRLGAAARRRAETDLTWNANARRVLATCERARETHAAQQPSGAAPA